MAFDYNHVPSFIAAIKEEKPFSTFLKDRYFPNGQNFTTDEVLVEYKKGNKKLAPFVAPRVGGVTMKRDGYSAKTFAPAYIAPKRNLTIDDLKKKRMGEALYSQMTPEDRASEIMLDDENELDEGIARRENWMAAQLLINASIVMEEKTDDPDVTVEKEIYFYEADSNDWIYTPSKMWSDPTADILGDIAAMCKVQAANGVRSTELLVDATVGAAILNNNKIKELLDNRNYNVGAVDPELVKFGVAKLARLNCNGYVVDILEYVEEYENDNGQSVPYLPKGYATLLAPACGTTSYGAVSQIEEDGEWHTYAENRVPLILTDKKGQSKELRLAAAPLLMPNRHHAWITAKVIEA